MRVFLMSAATTFVGCVAGVLLTLYLIDVDIDDRILRFGKKIQCPEPERVSSTTFDLRTGEYTCRYYRRYMKEVKR